MGSGLSTTDIANMALDYLDEAPLTSFDSDTGSVARWFRRNFWPIAWAAMRKHPWNFAIARAQLAETTAPAFGWLHAYDVPSDSLRILPLTTDGSESGIEQPYKVEGTQILTDLIAPINVRYIKRINNTGLFDNNFCEFLAATMGSRAAHFLTSKASYASSVGQIASGLLLEAQMIDGLEGTPDDSIDTFIEQARQ